MTTGQLPTFDEALRVFADARATAGQVNGDIIRVLVEAGPTPDPSTCMDLIYLLYRFIDGATGSRGEYLLQLADDTEAWDLLMRLADNESVDPVTLGALLYEDRALTLHGIMAANPATPESVIDVIIDMMFASAWEESVEIFIAGMVRRPTLNERHLRLILDQIVTDRPFGKDTRWNSDFTFDRPVSRAQAWISEAGGIGPSVAIMLSTSWPHAQMLTEQDRSALTVLAAGA